MLKNSSKLIFFVMTIFSSLFIFSSYSWLSIWMGLEINLISFISLILSNKKSYKMEATILYFIVQSLASILFLFSIIIYLMKLSMSSFINKIYYEGIMLSLLMKIGSAPLHFWLPLMMEKLSWMNNYLLMTWQKLGPLMVLLNNLNQKILFFFIFFSTFIGALGGLNQTSLKKMMAFSSINQISWLLISLILSKFLMKIYYLFYFIISLNMLMLFNLLNLLNLNQFFNLKIFNKMILTFLFFNIFSMGGLPPFLGFFPKMLIIMNLNNKILMFMMIMFTLITLFYYLRILYFILFMNYLKINKIYKISTFLNMKINALMILSYFMNTFLLIFMFF